MLVFSQICLTATPCTAGEPIIENCGTQNAPSVVLGDEFQDFLALAFMPATRGAPRPRHRHLQGRNYGLITSPGPTRAIA